VKYTVTVGGKAFEIEVDHDRLVRVDGQSLYVELEQFSGLPLYTLALDDEGFLVFVEEGLDDYRVEVEGEVYPVEVQRQRPQVAARQVECDSGTECFVVCAPLAGNLLSVQAVVGQEVEAKQPLAVVESMKMRMELKAPGAGIVEEVHGQPGRMVRQGEELVTLRRKR